MKKVFLSAPAGSYSDLVQLEDALMSEGMDVFLPMRISPGTGSDWSDELFSAIKRSDLFVALLYGENANVMFELGYALGGGKRVLLICTSTVDVPFDVASLPAMTISQFDNRSISAAVAWIKEATTKSATAERKFSDAHEMLRNICEDEQFLDEVDQRSFEQCIIQVIQEKGFTPRAVATARDWGFDCEISDVFPGDLAVLEIKKRNRNSKVSVSEVQRIVGAAVTAGAKCAIVVTSGSFTASARYFADESPIRVSLLTIDELVELNPHELVDRCR